MINFKSLNELYDDVPLDDEIMFDNDEDAVKELKSYIDDSNSLYNNKYIPLIKGHVKRKKDDTYDHNLAVKGFKGVVDEASKMFAKERDIMQNWNIIFNQNVRDEIQELLTKEFETKYDEGEIGDI